MASTASNGPSSRNFTKRNVPSANCADAEADGEGTESAKNNNISKNEEDERISREFWRSLSSLSSPLYAADVAGSLCPAIVTETSATEVQREALDRASLFPLDSDDEADGSDDDDDDDDDARDGTNARDEEDGVDPEKRVHSSWHIGELDTLLTRTVKDKVPGVTTPYLYVGSWRSFFAWHTEDQDLYSINFLHFGARKTWYCIPPAKRERFERCMRDALPDLFQSCSEFLRHKEILCSPSWLQQHDIPFVTCSQGEGEIIINMPGALHAGFNHGFNCAESVNFATKMWVPIGRRAKSCMCARDSVRINMSLFASIRDDDNGSGGENDADKGGGSRDDDDVESNDTDRVLRSDKDSPNEMDGKKRMRVVIKNNMEPQRKEAKVDLNNI